MDSEHYLGGASLLGHPAATALQGVALVSSNTPSPGSSLPPRSKLDRHEAPHHSPSITRSGTPSTLFDRDSVSSVPGSPRSSTSSFPGPPGVSGFPIHPYNRDLTRSPAGCIRAQSPLQHFKRSKTPLHPINAPRSHRPQSPIGVHRPQSPLSGRPQSPLNASRALNSIASSMRPTPPSNLRQAASGDWTEKQSREVHLLQYLVQQAHAAAANRDAPSSGQPEDMFSSHEEDHCIDMHSPDSQDSTISAPTPKHISDMAVDPDTDEPSSQSTNSDGDCPERDVRVLKAILEAEFNIRLGRTQPPEDILETVSNCLQQITLSLDHHRSRGFLVPLITTSADNSSTSASTPSDHSSPPASASSASKRRTVSNGDEDGESSSSPGDGRDGDGDRDTPGLRGQGSQKKPKIEQPYPCPFRKRDPIVFNYRKYDRCVKRPFPSMSELKKHIRATHNPQKYEYSCPRCFEEFETPGARDAHIRQAAPNMCDLRHSDGAPGLEGETVSPSVSRTLRSRAHHFEWDTLWRALFPRDEIIPAPDFEPLVELHEVIREHQSGLEELRHKLLTALEFSLPNDHLLGRGGLIPSEKLCHEIENAVIDHMDGVFLKAKANATIPPPVSQVSAVKQTSHSLRETPSPRPLRPNPRTPSNMSSRPPSSTGAATSLHPRFDARHTQSVNSGASSPTCTSPLRNVHVMDADLNPYLCRAPHAASVDVSRPPHQNSLQPPAAPSYTNPNLFAFDQPTAVFPSQLPTGSYGAPIDEHLMSFPNQGQSNAPPVNLNRQQSDGIGNQAGHSPLGNQNYDLLAHLNMELTSSNAINQPYTPSTFPAPNQGMGFMMGGMNAGVNDISIAQRIHDQGHGAGVNGWPGGGSMQQGGMSGAGGYGLEGGAHGEDAQFHFRSGR